MKKIILAIVFMFELGFVYGQQLPLYTQFYHNPHAINPAFVRIGYEEYGLSVGVLHRQQWMNYGGIPNSPRTSTFYLNYTSNSTWDWYEKKRQGRIKKKNNGKRDNSSSGIKFMGGLYANLDKVGPTEVTGLYAHAGAFKPLGEKKSDNLTLLSIGAKIGYKSLRFNLEDVIIRDRRDQFMNENTNVNNLDLSVGAFLSFNQGNDDDLILYTGISVEQVLSTGKTYSYFLYSSPNDTINYNYDYNPAKQWNGILGIRIGGGKYNDEFSFEPYLVTRISTISWQDVNPFNFDLYLKCQSESFNNTQINGTIGFNRSGVVNLQVGLVFDDDKIAYEGSITYGVGTQKLNQFNVGNTIEINLKLLIDN